MNPFLFVKELDIAFLLSDLKEICGFLVHLDLPFIKTCLQYKPNPKLNVL